MQEMLAIGASRTVRITVDQHRTIGFMGDDCRVYATPSLIRDIEQACRDLIFDQTPEGEDSVGFQVNITHLAPTLLGMAVSITVTVSELDGRKAVFDITASDSLDQICKGSHVRFVVNVDKTRQRLQAKSAKAADL